MTLQEVAKLAPVVALLLVWVKWLLDRLKKTEAKIEALQEALDQSRDAKADDLLEQTKAMAESEQMVVGTLGEMTREVKALLALASQLDDRRG